MGTLGRRGGDDSIGSTCNIRAVLHRGMAICLWRGFLFWFDGDLDCGVFGEDALDQLALGKRFVAIMQDERLTNGPLLERNWNAKKNVRLLNGDNHIDKWLVVLFIRNRQE